MEIGTAFKLVTFLLWPFFLLFLYFLFDRKDFNRRLEKLKRNGFK